MRPDDPDLQPARTLWSEMYRETAPVPDDGGGAAGDAS